MWLANGRHTRIQMMNLEQICKSEFEQFSHFNIGEHPNLSVMLAPPPQCDPPLLAAESAHNSLSQLSGIGTGVMEIKTQMCASST
jgi:hypothetical protein